MLEGRNFIIYTDHKPITYAFQQDPLRSSPRQVQYLEYVGQFSTDIQHIKGKDNVTADTLSRIYSVQTAVDIEEIVKAQESDTELHELLEQETSLKLKRLPVPGTKCTAIQLPNHDLSYQKICYTKSSNPCTDQLTQG